MIKRVARSILDSIADAGEKFLDLKLSGGSTRALVGLCQDLISHKGVASGIALARQVVNQYQALRNEDKLSFFMELRERFGPNLEEVHQAVKDFERVASPDAVRALSQKTESSRRKLFTRMNMAPNGTAAIVSLREDLLRFTREHPELKAVDEDLAYLLTSWFNPGFLRLRRIDWDTEASVLEKIIHYEAVHNIANWNDLKQRLVQARRCFAYFHPALEDEPLIFVEVALTKGISTSIQAIIEDENPSRADADSAIFYSINNCQAGLRQIPLGNFLIKRVVTEIAHELPAIKTYSTLSPITGFAKWLANERAGMDSKIVNDENREILGLIDDPTWHTDPEKCALLKKPLSNICAHYLVNVKRREAPRNAVARFHFGNGASLHRINWLGDTSEHGIQEYHGLMVNYLYDLKQIESNHEAFVKNGEITVSKSIRTMLS